MSEIDRGDELLRALLDGKDDESTGNELLKCFFRGYPLENLRQLLRSDGAASELGSRAKPFLDEIVPLLHHSIRYVRFFAIDSILACAEARDAHALATVVRLIDDP